MSTAETVAQSTGESNPPMSREWQWHPDLPIPDNPLFQWPPRPGAILRWYARSWLALSTTTLWLVTAAVVWFWLQPGLARTASLEVGWIAQMWLRNAALITVFAGGLHLYFHTFKKQGKRLKFDKRDLAGKRKGFTWGHHTWDNMFWTLASGVTIWTVHEALYMWALANGWVPGLTWAENPAWFVALFLIIPTWSSFHFYWIHRLLHWPPLYKAAHALHHRNINIGPWTGISMHPLEHLLYFNAVILHVFVASHPLHVLFHLHVQALNPLASHSGFAGLLAGGKKRIALGDFFHQLHHRNFECNYGTAEIPWDKWFGSFHDGTTEATSRLRKRKQPIREGT